MSKRDRELRKRKRRERKVARAKIRRREEHAAALRKARFEEIRSILASDPGDRLEDHIEEDGDEGPGFRESDFDAERFNRYLWKAATAAGLDPDDLPEEAERELIEDWEEKREEMLEEDPVELAQELALQAHEEALPHLLELEDLGAPPGLSLRRALLEDRPVEFSGPVGEDFLAALSVLDAIGRSWRRVPGAKEWLREATRHGTAPEGA